MSFHIEWVSECSGEERQFRLATPVGALLISMRADVIVATDWIEDAQNAEKLQAIPAMFANFVDDYWLNTEKTLTVRLFKQGTDFSHKVWSEMLKIPLGQTLTYSALAKNIGTSARPVGNACRANPYPLIIPCHRVVSVNGLGGYHGHTDGQFMDIKTRLLAIESAKK